MSYGTCTTCGDGFYHDDYEEFECDTCSMPNIHKTCKSRLDKKSAELVEVRIKQMFLCLPFYSEPTDNIRNGDAAIVVQGNTEEQLYAHKFILRLDASVDLFSLDYLMVIVKTAVEAKPCRASTLPPCPDFPLARNAQSSRSPVFAKMFDTKMLEEETGVVLINDATLPVIRAVVKFCYDAEIDFTDEVSADDVMEVAHKYQISLLQTICEEHLIRTLNNENLLKNLKLAKKLEATGFEAAASNYFKDNFDSVISNVLVELC